MALQFAICELYHPSIHGVTWNPPLDISEQYIVREIFSLDEIMRNEHKTIISLMNKFYCHKLLSIDPHPKILNYNKIAKSMIQLQIVTVKEIIGEDGIIWYSCYIKTHYIKLLQRRWRAKLKERTKYISMCINLKAIRYRELTGKFPNYKC